MRQLESENARLAAGTTSATRDELKRAQARNAQLKEAGENYEFTIYPKIVLLSP